MPFPASAASVTTSETLAELHAAVASFLHQHPGTPVFVACPAELVGRLPAGCVAVPAELESPEGVAPRNAFHRPDAILLKMRAMRAAFEAGHPDCLFFDADLVFLDKVPAPPGDTEVCLSLNLSEQDEDMTSPVMVYGLFNAGFLWSKCPGFPFWWENEYLKPRPRDFYEQSCLSRAHRSFRVSVFPDRHNYGWWRGEAGLRPVSSLHVHLRDEVNMPPPMRAKALPLRLEALRRLPLPVLLEVRPHLQHPRKLFFVHFHKTGGVFFRHSIDPLLRGYRLFDSWTSPHSLGRDWEPEELRAHLALSDADGPLFLHQHAHNVTADDIVMAKENGWTIVMFYRDPRDIICSLYFFLQRRVMEAGVAHILDEPVTELPPFEQFFDLMLKNPRQWALPWWHGMVDHLTKFSPEAVREVCVSLFGAPPPALERKNASANPGWVAVLTGDQRSRLENHPDFVRSMAWLNPFDL